MKYCTNCGTKVENEITKCPECGTELPVIISMSEESAAPAEQKIDYSKEFDNMKAAAKETAGKAIVGAQKIAGQIAQKVEEKRAEMKAKAEEEARLREEEEQRQREFQREYEEQRRQEEAANEALQARNAAHSSNRYMSSTELWSWLKQSSKRQMFYTEEPSQMTESEFMEKVGAKMAENGVPAIMEHRNIQWDRSKVHRDTYFVQPQTNAVNPLSCMVQFNHIGKFTFVEEKTFITPPDLPPVPGTPLPLDMTKASAILFLFIFGGLLTLMGLMIIPMDYSSFMPGFMIMATGIGLMFWGYSIKSKQEDITAHNERCKQEEIAWAAAWSNWQNSIFLHSFQEDVNGQLSRIYDAVFECIKQVNTEEFTAIKVVEQEESSNLNELEELIARRKEEYR